MHVGIDGDDMPYTLLRTNQSHCSISFNYSLNLIFGSGHKFSMYFACTVIPDPNQRKTNIGVIVGGVLAGVGVVFIFTGVIIMVKFIHKRTQKSFRYDCAMQQLPTV